MDLPRDFLKRATAHYDHAVESHPRFCDYLAESKCVEFARADLAWAREDLALNAKENRSTFSEVLDKEIAETLLAIVEGRGEAAVEAAYDAIAVIMRAISVVEGRQRLGHPGEPANPWCPDKDVWQTT